MKTIEIKELSKDSFDGYGSYANMINPDTFKLGAEPIEFYRDMVQLDLGISNRASFSVCRVCKREAVLDISEYHDSCGEGVLPLDGDVLIHVAPATAGGPVPLDQIEVFRVPKGTMVAVRPGVWHHAPIAYNCDCANVLIVLPERIYQNDCKVHEIAEADRIKVEGA
jgi:ureidoglycolate lyase